MLAAASGYRFNLDLNNQLGMGQKGRSNQGSRRKRVAEKLAMGAEVSRDMSGRRDIRSDANRVTETKPEMGERC